MDKQIKVSVVFGLATRQKVIELTVSHDASVADIVAQSGMEAYFPDFDFSAPKVGVFNRAVKLKDTCRDGDRIEVYRPLIADPKAARLKRAEKAKAEGRADKVTGGRVNSMRKQD